MRNYSPWSPSVTFTCDLERRFSEKNGKSAYKGMGNFEHPLSAKDGNGEERSRFRVHLSWGVILGAFVARDQAVLLEDD